MSIALAALALALALSGVLPVSGEEGSEPVPDTPAAAWTATLTVGVHGTGSETTHGYSIFLGGMGTLSEDEFSADTQTIDVVAILLSNGFLAFNLKPEPSDDFVLTVDGTEFASADASEVKSRSITSSVWATTQVWAEDDTVALSLSWVESEAEPAAAASTTTTVQRVTEAPARPQGLSLVSATHETVELSWTDPQDATVTGYQILRRLRDEYETGRFDIVVADTGSAETSYTDDGVGALTRYVYRVKAINTFGLSQWSAYLRANTPAAPPSAPTGLSGTATAEAVTLSWDDPEDDTVTGYRVLRRERDAEPGPTVTVSDDSASTVTTFVDETVEAASKYTYRILALNSHGASPASVEAEVDTPRDPSTGLVRDSSRDIVITPLESWSGLEWSATGIWSDGERMWVLIDRVDEVLVFDLKTAEQLRSHSLGSGPVCPGDIWSDGETAWISNNWCGVTNQIYAYDLETWARVPGRDIESPDSELKGIAGDSDTIRVVSSSSDDPTCEGPMYAYELDDLERGDNRCGVASEMGRVFAAYSDGHLFWMMNFMGGLRVLELDSNTRVPSLEWFTTWNLGLIHPGGLWSDGATMWMSDSQGTLIRAFSMPERARLRLLKLTDVEVRPFLPAIFDYEAEVANDVSVTAITAEPAFSNGAADASISAAGVTADADSQTDGHQIDLSVGENAITIVVTAPDGVSTATYSVTVTRAAPVAEDLAPGGLTATLAEGGGVSLSWTAPAKDADSVSGYEILRAVGDGEPATLVADTASTTTTYSDATATEAGESYAYEVKAIRSEELSQSSGRAQVQIPHDPVDLAPSNLTAATAEGGGVTLSWTAPAEDAENVSGYEILRVVGDAELTTLVADSSSTTATYTDTTATEAGQTYAYEVKAIRGEERSQSSSRAQVQIPHDPVALAPSNLTAATAEGGGVTLSWTAPAEDAGNVSGYEILRAVGDGEPATLVADTASTTATYTDATATEAGQTYAYEVKAIRGEERSQVSGQVRVQIPHDPVDLAPSGLIATLPEGGGVALSWAAPAEDADSVSGYEILRAAGDGELATLVADTGGTATAYSDATATTAGETYTYQVNAIRTGVRSQASAEASVALTAAVVATCEFDAGGSDLPADTSTACALEVDGSVRGERATVGDVDWYRLSLQASATYQIDMRGKSTGGWQLVDGAPAFVSVGTLEDPKLLGIYDASGLLVTGTDSEVAGTGKDSRIESFSPDADGVYFVSASAESGWTGTYELSLTVTTGTHIADLTLLAPGGLTAAIAVGGGVALGWTAPAAGAASVDGYRILRGVGEGEMFALVADSESTATSYSDATATEAGTTYVFQVIALRGNAASQGSDTTSITIPAASGVKSVEADDEQLVDAIKTIAKVDNPVVAKQVVQAVGGFQQVDAGWDHVCALRMDGTVECWGDLHFSEREPRTPEGIFTQIVAGNDSSCGIQADGYARCWDGFGHVGAVREGKIQQIHTFSQPGICWLNEDGSVGCGGDANSTHSGPFKLVTSGYNFFCALNADDEVVCRSFGGSATSQPPGGKFTFLQAGGYRVCGISKDGDPNDGVNTDGDLVCWEFTGPWDDSGRWIGHQTHVETNAPTGKFQHVDMHYRQSCAVTVGGDIKCWIANGSTTALVTNVNRVAPQGVFKEVTIDWYRQARGLKTDTSIVCWNSAGEEQEIPSFDSPWKENAKLLKLELSGIDFAFDRDTASYTLSVDNDVASTTVTAGATNTRRPW